MVVTATYAGVDQPDVASLESGGEFYRCFVYRNVARNTIDATIKIENPGGVSVIVWSGVVRDVEADGDARHVGDMPKVLGLDNGIFVAHWIESDSSGGASAIHRATIDVGALALTWTYQSSQAIHNSTWAMYDHAVVRDGTTSEFVVAWIDNIADIGGVDYGDYALARYEADYAWTDTVWSVTSGGNTVVNRLLSLVADDDADAVVGVAFQAVGNALLLTQHDSADGLNFTFATVSTGLAASQFAQVGLVQFPGLSACALVAEYALQAGQTAGGRAAKERGIFYRECALGSGAAVSTSVQWTPGLHMVSRPWTRANGYDEHEVYCLVSAKSVSIANRAWDQTFGYVVRLNRRDWSAVQGAGTIRAIACSILGNGSFDGRASGSSPSSDQELVNSVADTRVGHISSVSYAPSFTQGPNVKSVVLAALHFERTIASQDSDVEDGERDRAQAAVKGVRHFHEEPWTRRRDTADPTREPALPAALNFRGYSPYAIGRNLEVASGLLIAGGVLSQYDGRQLVEVGFTNAPEIEVVQTGTGGGGTGIHQQGVYWVVGTYSWTDLQGVVHRSAPSTPQSVTVGPLHADAFTYAARTVPLTLKDDRHHYPDAPRILLEFWRTALLTGSPEGEANGSLLFRRVFSGNVAGMGLGDTPVNDASIPAVTGITDILPSDDLQYNDLLPWQLNTETLQYNLATPTPSVSARAPAKWKNRLFSVPMDDPNIIQYSDEFLPLGLQNAAAEHFDTNKYRFDSRGFIVAMQAMDNDLIIFTRDGIYALTGEGNDATGANATLDLQVIATDTGCVEEGSVVYTPAGILFQSAKGFYLLNREQQLDHASAGAALSELVRTLGNVREGTLLEDRHVVRYVCNRQPAGSVVSPTILDYNYELKIWAIHPLASFASGTAAVLQSGVAWRGRMGQTCHVVLAENGLAVERGDDDTNYSDENFSSVEIPIPLDAQTEWIHLAGASGLVRIRSIGIQTERVDPGEVSVDVYHDINGEYDETLPTDTFTWSSPAPAYMRLRPSLPKCSAIMLRIYESGVVPATENLRIVSITLEIGQKTRTRRVPVGQVGV